MTALTILTAGQAATMSSREIAELTGSSHDSVLKTIRRLVIEGVVSANETPYTHPQNGQKYPQFILDFRNTMVVVSGYSSELRAKIIDRWQELEAGAVPVALNVRDPLQLVTLTTQLIGYTQELQSQLTAQAPKVAFADAVGSAVDLQPVGTVAKALGTGERRLFAFMRDNGILMVNNLPFQHHIDAGRFKVIEKPWKDAEGNDRIRTQTMVTGKGITFLQQRLVKQREVAHG